MPPYLAWLAFLVAVAGALAFGGHRTAAPPAGKTAGAHPPTTTPDA